MSFSKTLAAMLIVPAAFAAGTDDSMFAEAPEVKAPEASIETPQMVRNPDGSITLETTIGKFGPKVPLRIPNMSPHVEWQGQMGRDSQGRPISLRRQKLHEAARQMAAEMEKEYQEKLRRGEVPPRPKMKSQAEEWEELNQKTLEEERLHGRKTNSEFVIPGKTPEESRRIQAGEEEPVIRVLKPEKKALILAEDAPKAGPEADAAAAVPVRGASSAEEYFSDMGTNPVTDYFSDMGRFSEPEAKPAPASAPGKTSKSDFGARADRFFALLTLSTTAQAAQARSAEDLGIKENRAAAGFEALAKSMKKDAEAYRKKVDAERQRREAEARAKAEDCDACSLPKESSAPQPLAPAQTGLSEEGEAMVLSEADKKIIGAAFDLTELAQKNDKGKSSIVEASIESILETITDDSHPASFRAIMEEAYRRAPEVKQYVPDFEERLGLGGADLAKKEEEVTYIFVSYSMGDEALRDVMKTVQGRSDVTLVMRGIPDGTNLGTGLMRMQNLARELDPMPNIILDPTLFQDFEITAVPSVVRAKVRTGIIRPEVNGPSGMPERTLLAKAAGLANDKWLIERIEAGEKGDLGVRGDTKAIAERDLIEVMKEKVHAIDWEKKKRDAVENYWTKQTYDVLPSAETYRRREIDPSIYVTADIKDAAGNIIRRAGEVVNPLDIRPFTSVMLIFNPLREKEVTLVLAEMDKFRKSGRREPMLIASEFSKEKGWDAYKALTDRFDAHIYRLMPDVKERWAVEKTPSVITADMTKKVFVVEELPVEAGGEAVKEN